jgi:hypothetical protein
MPAEDMRPFLVGVLSDSHGELHPEIAAAFAGVDHIVHAGDVGSESVLLELQGIAPVTVVRGNTDPPFLGVALLDRATPVLGGIRFAVVHEPVVLNGWTLPSDTVVVVTGHTHRPAVERETGVLYVNPGSASYPRGHEGRTIAIVEVTGDGVEARIVPLAAG